MGPGGVLRPPRQPNAITQPNANMPDTLTVNDDGKRKKTRNKFLKKYLKKSNVKPRIVIEGGMTTPVEEWSLSFITEVNIICRQYAPLNCRDWINLDIKDKETLFHDRIKGEFDIDLHLEHVTKAVNRYLGIRFRDFSCKIYMYYKKFGSNDRLRRTKPYLGVSHENWEIICDWFQSDNCKKLSARNSTKKQQQEVNHCADSVSFARFQHKKCDPETRQPLSRIELYHQTHFSEKRSRWVAPVAAEKYDAMITRQMQTMDEDPNTLVDEGPICDQVLGKRKGYTRGLGNGVIRISKSSSYTSSIVEDLRRNAENSNRRLEKAERCAIEAEKRNEELNADIRGQARKLDEFEGWKDKMEMFMSRFGAN